MFIVEPYAKVHCFLYMFTTIFVVCLILLYSSKLIVEIVESVYNNAQTL